MAQSKVIVIYHGNCPDGFTAAWVLRKWLGPGCEYVPANYGEAPPDCTGRDVFIVDFSYKRPVILDVLNKAKRVVVLDHHKTAEAELRDISEEYILSRQCNGDGVMEFTYPVIKFDMSKSGARLAWDYVYNRPNRPWIVDYVEDRDLWKWDLPSSREINAAIASYPMTFEQWDAFEAIAPESLIAEGAAIERFKARQVDSAVAVATETEIGGHRVKAVNATVNFSEVAGKLAEGHPFGAAWFRRADGKYQYSLRSRDGGIDVSEVAKGYGGGGHRNAAGFEIDRVL